MSSRPALCCAARTVRTTATWGEILVHHYVGEHCNLFNNLSEAKWSSADACGGVHFM